jgi:pyruvate dehydrogenase E2 component (dihydrolipoamide acetyltransferase)
VIIEVEIPKQGLTITEATLVRWIKSVGESVNEGEMLFEFETDKASVEVESPASGKLVSHLASEGEIVPLGNVVAKISTEESDVLEAEPAPPQAPPAVEAAAPRNGHHEAAAPVAPEPRDDRPLVSPRARRVADELGVDLAEVVPTGRRGRHIRECDVVLAAENRRPTAPSIAAPFPDTKPVEMSRLRRLTAAHTERSFREVPHFHLTREINAQKLAAFRAELLDGLAKTDAPRVTVTDFLIRALAIALKRHPNVNAQWRDGALYPGSDIAIGVAVSTPSGLIVPAIRHADALSLVGIAEQRQALVERARQGKTLPEELEGGTFTLTNLGQTGVDQFDAIVNAPQSGILAAGSIKPRPYVVDGAVCAVPTMFLTLAMDHRVVDGEEAARFLATVSELLEAPSALCAI